MKSFGVIGKAVVQMGITLKSMIRFIGILKEKLGPLMQTQYEYLMKVLAATKLQERESL